MGKLFTPEKNRSVMKSLYGKKLFMTFGKPWRKGTLNAALKSWWMRHMDAPIGIRLHRHFAISLQRHALNYGQEDPRLRAAQEALAHSRTVDELHYGKKKGDSDMPKSKQEHFETVSKDYLNLFGFSDPSSYSESFKFFSS